MQHSSYHFEKENKNVRYNREHHRIFSEKSWTNFRKDKFNKKFNKI